MYKKIIGILVMMLLITTALPAVGLTIEKVEIENSSTLQNGPIDQEQTSHCGSGFPLSPPYWQAQEFKPTKEDLKLVKLYFFKYETPPDGVQITIIIRDSLNGSDLTTITINADDAGIKSSGTWVSFDFSDITVIPETTYYIICYADGGDQANAYCWLFDEGNSYPRGIAWQSDDGENWYDLENYAGYTEIDFCFKTYHETSRNRAFKNNFNLLNWLFERFSLLERLLSLIR
jgi:hypothetical protein